jgi:hypothetical protein
METNSKHHKIYQNLCWSKQYDIEIKIKPKHNVNIEYEDPFIGNINKNLEQLLDYRSQLVNIYDNIESSEERGYIVDMFQHVTNKILQCINFSEHEINEVVFLDDRMRDLQYKYNIEKLKELLRSDFDLTQMEKLKID